MKTNAAILHENLNRLPILSFRNYQHYDCVMTQCMLLENCFIYGI